MKKAAVIAIILAVPLVVAAKAMIFGKKAMFEQSEIIAVVDVTKVDKTITTGRTWTYHEEATASVERVFKGKLPKKVTLYGGEDFICAQVHFPLGKQLVFLRHDEKLLTGANWFVGVRPIKDDKLEWLADDKTLDFKAADLASVIKDIEGELKKK